MAIRVGILTSGGDCPGLNATLRGVAKALYHRMGDKVEIVGIMNGYDGLINGNFREMSPDEFSGILTVGGTILGTKRTPFKKMRVVEEDKVDKVAAPPNWTACSAWAATAPTRPRTCSARRA